MTLTEAAALLGVTAATLRQQIARGRLKARKHGRDWSVSPQEVERYRATSRRAP
jgi:excisionase family DNA binding protein